MSFSNSSKSLLLLLVPVCSMAVYAIATASEEEKEKGRESVNKVIDATVSRLSIAGQKLQERVSKLASKATAESNEKQTTTSMDEDDEAEVMTQTSDSSTCSEDANDIIVEDTNIDKEDSPIQLEEDALFVTAETGADEKVEEEEDMDTTETKEEPPVTEYMLVKENSPIKVRVKVLVPAKTEEEEEEEEEDSSERTTAAPVVKEGNEKEETESVVTSSPERRRSSSRIVPPSGEFFRNNSSNNLKEMDQVENEISL